ncbi:MAG: TrmB family transcriptional regulator [Lachnospiraceae bacterium]
MDSNSFSEHLMEFGLTRQEAGIYECLLCEGKVTGYEVAKILGISRSNAYNSLASMTEKGASYLVEEGSTKKYVPVPLEEFCKNYIRRLEESKRWLVEHKPSEKTHTEGYVTIEGARNILDMLRNLLMKAEERVYISCTRNYLLLLVEEVEQLISAHKKVVIITDQAVNFKNAKVYIGEPRGMQIGIITDSKYVLTGEYGEGSMNTCLYSGQKNFVELYKRSLSNEIKLLAIQEKESKQEEE